MKILYVIDKFGELLLDHSHLLGGAELTALTYLKRLAADYGHACKLVTPFTVKRKMTYEGVPIESFRDLEEFKRILISYRPDVVLSGLNMLYENVRCTLPFSVPNVLFFDSYEYCEPSEEEKLRSYLSLTKPYPPRAQAEFAIKNAHGLIACSKYLQTKLNQRYGVSATVIYPPIELSKTLLSDNDKNKPKRFITGFCGMPHKGVEIFLRLCEQFSDESFLLVGRISPEYREELSAFANVTYSSSGNIKELLAESKAVLVPSQWKEPFGRIAVEAMANSIPTLVSRVAGLAEIVGDSSLGVDDFRNWQAWERSLHQLIESEEARTENVAIGRTLAAPFLSNQSIRQLNERILSMANHRVEFNRHRKSVVLVGSSSKKTAFSLINSHLQRALGQDTSYSVKSFDGIEAVGLPSADIYIHHDFETEFSQLSAPPEGKWIVMRTWDFGLYPRAWVKKINEDCDQLWVHSRWVKELAIRSGITRERVKVIPLGFDETVFKPEGRAYDLPTNKQFKFLFVGAPILRKGVDILINAFCEAFSSDDDVSLIIKGNPDDVFYQDITLRERVLQLQGDPSCPEIIFIDAYLSDHDLSALYRSCQVGVFPYRAEGFSLSILEAMACGLPSIVPRFGACLDYCSHKTSFLIKATRINLPVKGAFKFNTLGFEEQIDEVDFCEVSTADLVAEMRRVAHLSKTELMKKAEAGQQQSHAKFKWSDCARAITKQIQALESRRTPIRLLKQRRENEDNLKKFQAAKEMFLSRPA
ncbi:MAG TPA: glycosyltransferase family 4 protein [Blastocatellia bacterium]|nr:glycosyltransferase family 4 protein [Blastocatellia bacterium]